MKILSVINAEYIGELSVKIFFNDETTSNIDVGEFIKKHPHPQYNKYLEEKNFKKFKIDSGNVVWGNNWDLIFPIEQLYDGALH